MVVEEPETVAKEQVTEKQNLSDADNTTLPAFPEERNRSALVSNAVTFLRHERVKRRSTKDKRRFLVSKGLTLEEVRSIITEVDVALLQYRNRLTRAFDLHMVLHQAPEKGGKIPTIE